MDFLRSLATFIVFCQLFLWKVNSEYFTSIVGLETLLKTKDGVVKALDEYLTAEEERLRKVKMYREEYKRLFESERSDVQRIITNPLNAYILVKRLTTDWQMLKELLKSSEDVVLGSIEEKNIDFPTEEDLAGAADGLVRLQQTYKLGTPAVADGYILDIKTSVEFTAGDCFEVGRQMLIATYYDYCTEWMKEALSRLDKESTNTTSKEKILEKLAYSLFREGNLEAALKFTNELLEIVPDHRVAKRNKKFLLSKNATNVNVTAQEENSPSIERFKNITTLAHTLCRGEKFLTAAEESKLKCHYSYGTDPYFMIQPFKVEDLFLDPEILLYHDFLTDQEIKDIVALAKPWLMRASVVNEDKEEEEFTDDRISKIAWLRDEEHSTVRKISKRITSATGLTLSTAEEMQVLNYGIAGHYVPHYDFAQVGEYSILNQAIGNRIATWLNYMSNVEAGGATAFPKIGISVKPKKGSAILWYNLLKNGTGDLRTLHTACPVLIGSKWVSNKWFHERGQEFVRKCGLKNE